MSPALELEEGRARPADPTDELRRRRGKLAQGMQMAALGGLPAAPEDAGELPALNDEPGGRG